MEIFVHSFARVIAPFFFFLYPGSSSARVVLRKVVSSTLSFP